MILSNIQANSAFCAFFGNPTRGKACFSPAPDAFQIVTFRSYSEFAPFIPYIHIRLSSLSTPFPRGNPHFPQGFPQVLCVNPAIFCVFSVFIHTAFLYALFCPQTNTCFCQTEVTFGAGLCCKCDSCSEFVQKSAEKSERKFLFSLKNCHCANLFPVTHRFIHAVYITELFHVYHFYVFVNLKTV